MLIREILERQKTLLSFEFFPPKFDNGWDSLFETIASLVPLNPSFVSVTYGAGGSTRQNTHQLVSRISKETSLSVSAHLTCVDSTQSAIRSILQGYAEVGVQNIMALRGDPPKGQPANAPLNYDADLVTRATDEGFAYASDLVAFIKKHFPRFCVGVSGFPEGHPMTPNRLQEIGYLKAKVDAGADYIVTQLFFNNQDFYDFCERCDLAGIHVPIIAGIMPISTYKGMLRMAELAAGARFPASLLRAVERVKGNNEHVEEFGVHWATEQIRDLLDHQVRGIHLYTLNKSKASLRICRTLGITNVLQLSS
ncbi:MAG: methylenetetrahydrofolate reductase [NAD(P)H] [bacterium]|nr:methylenetetrahydrofolate reductase [NAD(P)H] [bacterium]